MIAHYNVQMKKILWLAIPLVLLGAYLYKPEGAPPSPEAKTPVKEEPEPLREVAITIQPGIILQGDPAFITIENLPAGAYIKSLTFNGKSLYIFDYNGKTSALAGIDLRQTTGSNPLVLTLSDDHVIKKNLVVGTRAIVKVPLGIPEKLGGDSPESEQELLNTLIKEGAIINAIQTSDSKLWDGKFTWPLREPIVVTDVYGYSRLTGASTIAHKGTDFRAATGTPVYAMNSGKVAFTDYLRNYGNTIIIDHGLGLLTIYMHLSEIDVKVGNRAEKRQLIGKSGDTGYVLGPHLHVTVRINNISIDPLKFMALLGED